MVRARLVTALITALAVLPAAYDTRAGPTVAAAQERICVRDAQTAIAWTCFRAPHALDVRRALVTRIAGELGGDTAAQRDAEQALLFALLDPDRDVRTVAANALRSTSRLDPDVAAMFVNASRVQRTFEQTRRRGGSTHAALTLGDCRPRRDGTAVTLECRHPIGCRPACMAAYAVIQLRVSAAGPRAERFATDERDDGSCGHCM